MISDPKSLKKALMVAKSITSSISPDFGVAKVVPGRFAEGGYIPHGDPRRDENLAAHMAGSKTPPVLYHGTGVHEATMGENKRPLGDIEQFDRHAAFKAFNRPEGMDAVGTWLSETPGDHTSARPGAGLYAGSNGAVYPVHARIKNPWVPRDFDHFLDEMHLAADRDPKAQKPRGRGSVSELRNKLIAAGHDGIYFSQPIDHRNQSPTWVAFDPHQIKSAVGNNGQFDPSKPKITESHGGYITPPHYTSGGAVDDVGKTVPESPHTIALQRQMLVDGKKAAVLHTSGSSVPPPEGMAAMHIPDGLLHYNPQMVSPQQIVHAVRSNRLNDVLGLGPYSKDDIFSRLQQGEQPLAVVIRDHGGHEALSSFGTHATAEHQIAAMRHQVPDGGSIGVEPVENVLRERVGQFS